mmetsp:Transcript_20486/g.46501  ORF Transcript_20486/g.46501 Transcript_20486/m.46501 type:complete len:85 (-) Transcript_20486:138-392(-)
MSQKRHTLDHCLMAGNDNSTTYERSIQQAQDPITFQDREDRIVGGVQQHIVSTKVNSDDKHLNDELVMVSSQAYTNASRCADNT